MPGARRDGNWGSVLLFRSRQLLLEGRDFVFVNTGSVFY